MGSQLEQINSAEDVEVDVKAKEEADALRYQQQKVRFGFVPEGVGILQCHAAGIFATVRCALPL